jgi:hypothetical protein
VKIQQFAFLPSIVNGQLYWGYVNFQSDVSWPVIAAPYLVDLLTFSICFIICLRVKFSHRWIWLNLVIIGLISPLINSAYNYLGGLFRSNDVSYLLDNLPSTLVHVYFIFTLLIYLIGLIIVLRSSIGAAIHQSSGSRA